MTEIPSTDAENVFDAGAQVLYEAALQRGIENGLLGKDLRTLVTFGGELDAAALSAQGFTDVVISNVDERQHGDSVPPYPWEYADAEKLGFDDNSFDQVIAHRGLHHALSPPKALAEMIRVASRAVMFVEPADTLASRASLKFGFGQNYEVAAVVGNGGKYGGVNNTAIPNHVYRFTKREVEKIARSAAPTCAVEVHTFPVVALPVGSLRRQGKRARVAILNTVGAAMRLVSKVSPQAGNNGEFFVIKGDRHQWITDDADGPTLDMDWAAEHFGNQASTTN